VEIMNITGDSLRDFYYRVLLAVGTGTEEASITADALIDADLHGLETHGAFRIPAYVRIAQENVLDAEQKPQIEWRKGALSLINGNNGWGQPAARLAVSEVIANAKTSCIGAAGVYNTNHIGTCAYYARMLARAGLVGFVTTNSPPNMPPTGGAEAVLGTNPICFSAPASGGRVVVVDMATSIVAKGKIMLAAERGDAIPEDWAVDKDGHPTTDPKAAMGGYLLPVGGPKGYGLAFFAEVFAGVLTGAEVAKDLTTMYSPQLRKSGVGAFLFGIDTAAFGASDVSARMDKLIAMVVGSKLAEGVQKIYLPGEIEQLTAARRKQEGIAVSAPVLANLNKVAVALGITPLSTA
jgi:LDH2 family malate/lactate/ureidoglycolate dehydrogenase